MIARAAGERVRFLRFLVAAGLSVPVNLGTRVLLSRWLPYELAVLVSHACGMVVAWALSRAFVFEPSGASRRLELLRFATVNAVSAAVTWVVAVGLVRVVFPRVGPVPEGELVAHVVGLAASAVVSFHGHRSFSFRRGRTPP